MVLKWPRKGCVLTISLPRRLASWFEQLRGVRDNCPLGNSPFFCVGRLAARGQVLAEIRPALCDSHSRSLCSTCATHRSTSRGDIAHRTERARIDPGELGAQ